jgi:hypothetical protein
VCVCVCVCVIAIQAVDGAQKEWRKVLSYEILVTLFNTTSVYDYDYASIILYNNRTNDFFINPNVRR